MNDTTYTTTLTNTEIDKLHANMMHRLVSEYDRSATEFDSYKEDLDRQPRHFFEWKVPTAWATLRYRDLCSELYDKAAEILPKEDCYAHVGGKAGVLIMLAYRTAKLVEERVQTDLPNSTSPMRYVQASANETYFRKAGILLSDMYDVLDKFPEVKREHEITLRYLLCR